VARDIAATSNDTDGRRRPVVPMLVADGVDTPHLAAGVCGSGFLMLEDAAMNARFKSGSKVWCAPVE
jgi:hypothetical protein